MNRSGRKILQQDMFLQHAASNNVSKAKDASLLLLCVDPTLVHL